MRNKRNTSWQHVAPWYKKITQGSGHYYHEHVVIPGVLKLLQLSSTDRLLDIACGEGVLARAIPKDVTYVGFDSASSLITTARARDKNPKHSYLVEDATNNKLSTLSRQPSAEPFTKAVCILALQNMEDGKAVMLNAAKNLEKDGTFIIVLNHPCFRIPRQSSWGIDEANKMQYRKINRYLSPLSIPINAHPSHQSAQASPEATRQTGDVTWSFHNPLSTYTQWLNQSGFVTEIIEEWSSDKESEGKAAKMENRSRAEFPLFLAIKARLLVSKA